MLKKLYQFLDIPSPIVEIQGITPSNRVLYKEDFITKEEKKKLKNILSSPKGLTGGTTFPLTNSHRLKCIHPINFFRLWAHTTRTRIVTDATGELWKEHGYCFT
ncbi:hypothetical protein [Bacillus thuringiensis]|uniref:Uncharacterized protein n=1 Tax=Bacillus thuringiensis DB27 TaxID=1431339 RepID=W8YM90_BACTU|nr:hypothetical protein [Bacillus thuringiensis]MBG9633480.1 hypothetical protein [Bacillus thuringiensis]MBG9669407.1 hypothetical protein [Bacillus thuringiensis]MBH0355304.1 hypothetical protein [Bacillus thuringiensis]CDN39516.1 unnamed protein product [Bacillus thuringiensis DB27]